MAGTIERLDFEISAKADRFTQTVDQASGKLDQLVARAQSSASKMQTANAGIADSYFHVVDRLKVAAAAVDNLGAKTDALTGKQHTAWTAVAGVVGGATGSMITKMEQFVDASQKAADGAESGFQKTATTLWASTDALRVANDRLEISTEKLLGKRPNYLALQLDEARVASDKLADSLVNDQQKITAVLSQNHQSWWHTLLHQGTTSKLEGTVGSMQQQLSDAGNQQQIDLHKGDIAAASQDRKSIDSGLAYLAQRMQATIAEIDRDAAAHKGPDRKVERSEAVGVLAQTSARQDDLTAQDKAVVDQEQNRRAADAKEAAEKAKAAAAAALAAQRQAAERQFAAMEDVMNRRKALEQVDVVAQLNYWEAQLGPAQKYSENVSKVYAKLGELNQEYYRQLDEMAAKGVEDQKRDTAAMLEQFRTLEEIDDKWAKAIHRDTDALAALAAVNQQSKNALAEMTTSHDVSTGAVNRNAAALKMATLHASSYAAALTAIAREKQADEEDSSLSPDQRKANQDQRDVRAATIKGEAERTAQQDQWNVFATTGLGGATLALQEFIAQAKDSATQWKELTTSVMGGINDVLLKDLTSRNTTGHQFRQDLGNFGADEFRKIAGFGLSKLESIPLQGVASLLSGHSGSRNALSRSESCCIAAAFAFTPVRL